MPDAFLLCRHRPRQLDGLLLKSMLCIQKEKIMPDYYIRYEVERYNYITASMMGVFGATHYLIEEKEEFNCKEIANRTMKWFSNNLLKPTKQRYKGFYGISWFKSCASEHVFHAEQLCNVLEMNNIRHRKRVTHDLLNIIYEDQHQVVSISQLLLSDLFNERRNDLLYK
jgi:hypothetical protein